MNPTKSAAPIPKIHRVALVDNDPRALESLSLLIEAKVPTAYVVWTATSGDEAIERCQRNDDNLNLLVLDMSMEGLQGAGHLPSDPSHGQAFADSGHHQLLHQQLP